MALDTDTLAALGAIYATASGVAQWREALDRVAQVAGGNGAMLMVRDSVAEELSIAFMSTRYKEIDVADYVPTIADADESRWITALEAAPPRTILTDLEVWPDRAVYDRMPSVEVMRTLHLYHRCGARLCSHGGWHDVVAVLYREERDGIATDESRRLSALLPHIARAIELQRPFVLLERRYRAVLSVLDRLGVGVLILRHDGQPVLRNREAERLLDARDPLRIDARGRVSAPGNDGARLAQAIARASQAATPAGSLGQDAWYLYLQRQSTRERLVLDIAPFREDLYFDTPFTGALCLLVDPEQRALVSTDGLARSYGLTVAERDVCRLIADGLTANEIADARSVSLATVKAQTRAIFAKTHTRNRADLVRRAHSIVPPLVDDDGQRTN